MSVSKIKEPGTLCSIISTFFFSRPGIQAGAEEKANSQIL